MRGSGPRAAAGRGRAVVEPTAADGFTPEWICRTDAESLATPRGYFGQGFTVRGLPSDRVALGWSYLPRARGKTAYLLAEVRGERVLIFFGREPLLRRFELDPPDGMQVFRGEVGGVQVLEVSPLDEPAFIEFFVVPGDSHDA